MTSDLESNIVAVERVKEYSETKTEVSTCRLMTSCSCAVHTFTVRKSNIPGNGPAATSCSQTAPDL